MGYLSIPYIQTETHFKDYIISTKLKNCKKLSTHLYWKVSSSSSSSPEEGETFGEVILAHKGCLSSGSGLSWKRKVFIRLKHKLSMIEDNRNRKENLIKLEWRRLGGFARLRSGKAPLRPLLLESRKRVLAPWFLDVALTSISTYFTQRTHLQNILKQKERDSRRISGNGCKVVCSLEAPRWCPPPYLILASRWWSRSSRLVLDASRIQSSNLRSTSNSTWKVGA